MRARITSRLVTALQRGDLWEDEERDRSGPETEGARRTSLIADDQVKGFVARRLPSGDAYYGFRYRNLAGVQRWMSLGHHGSVTADEARRVAKGYAAAAAAHRDPVAEIEAEAEAAAKAAAADKNTVASVIGKFMEDYVRKNLRSASEIDRVFKVYVIPFLGARSIYSIRRSDIFALLDQIADKHGSVMADTVLAHVRSAFRWHAARDELFNTPIVPRMARTKPSERARDRKLSDEEIRDLWQALDGTEPAPFAALVRVLLLTGQRRREVAGMRMDEITDESGDPVWVIPASRHKSKSDHAVPLTETTLAAIRDGIAERRDGYVFSLSGGASPLTSFSDGKAKLNPRITETRAKDGRGPMAHWTLHDLRRTARSLMSRAGVDPNVAERTIGHVIGGVRGVYDRYEYLDEKKDALQRLAALIERILEPPGANVASLIEPRRQKSS